MEHAKHETKQKIKKQTTMHKILGIVTDILLYPVLILAIVVSGIVLTTRSTNQVIPIFGISFVRVLSGSMVAGGYDIGDVVILNTVDATDIKIGDVIAFYRYSDSEDPSRAYLEKIEDFDNPPPILSETRVCGTKTKKDAVDAEATVIFHRVVAVFQAKDGTRFFETKGDSNSSKDGTLVRQDFVVGRDIGTPEWLLNIFAFCFSTKGMLYLVIIPLGILIFVQLLEIFELIFALMVERDVLSLKIAYNSEESIKNNIGFEMRDFDKVYFYDIAKDEEKQDVKDFLWGNLYQPQNKSELRQLNIVESGIALLPNREQYWNYFIQNAKTSRTKKQLIKLQQVANTIVLNRKHEPTNKDIQQNDLKSQTQNGQNKADQTKIKSTAKTKSTSSNKKTAKQKLASSTNIDEINTKPKQKKSEGKLAKNQITENNKKKADDKKS